MVVIVSVWVIPRWRGCCVAAGVDFLSLAKGLSTPVPTGHPRQRGIFARCRNRPCFLISQRFICHPNNTLDGLQVVNILNAFKSTVSDGFFNIVKFGGFAVDGNNASAID